MDGQLMGLMWYPVITIWIIISDAISAYFDDYKPHNQIPLSDVARELII